MRIALAFVLLFEVHACLAQFGAVRQAQARMDKSKWASAKAILEKASKKDTSNVELSLSLAQWFFSKPNPNYQLDSAYRYCSTAIRQYAQLDGKQKERLQRLGIDSTTAVSYREKMDSAAFVVAKESNTEKSYTQFIKRYPLAKERASAIELRDEVSFLETLKINTYQSFQDYFNNHPQSHRGEEAKNRYDKLLFESKTKDRKLKSYVSFVQEFPESPYRAIADRQIFEMFTARGDTTSFLQFIEQFPKNRFRMQAINWLFHMYVDFEKKVPLTILNDSLRNVTKLNKDFWSAILDKGKFGFIDSKGTITFTPKFESVDERYRCGGITDDLLVTNEGLISRDGNRITKSWPIQQRLGLGFYKIGDSSCLRVLHKSGQLVIDECAQGIQLLGNSFLAMSQSSNWKLYTLTGRLLLNGSQWDEIEMIEGVMVFSRYGKKLLLSKAQVESSVDGSPVAEELVFDHVGKAGPDRIVVRNGSLEGLLNSNLEFIVPFERQTLSVRPFGLLRKINDQFSIAEAGVAIENKLWNQVRFYKQWLLLKTKTSLELYDLKQKKILDDGDSCWFAGGIAFIKKKDSIYVHLNSTQRLSFPSENPLTFVKSRDSIRYFFVEAKKKKTVYDVVSGQKLFTQEFDQIESYGENTFLISRKSKKGIVSKTGKIILPVDYEAIVQLKDHYWSIYKEKKFGLFDSKDNRLVKPISSRNINLLTDDILILYSNGYLGLTKWDGKPITSFEFDEIQPWGESKIWGKQNGNWVLYNFQSGKTEIEKIKEFSSVKNSVEDRVLIIRKDNSYGVISLNKGMLIPTTFTAIVNIGTDDQPLYFTDKEIKEADIHVVIYYDQAGKLLRKQVYEEVEFEKIFCDE